MHCGTRPLLISVVISLCLIGLDSTGTNLYAKSDQNTKPIPAFQTVVKSHYGFDDTVEILKGAIEGENLMIIKEINPQKMLRMVNVRTKGMRQFLFFHPSFMKRIMAINPHATIEPPLKIAVMETPQGTTMVKYIKPSYLFGRYDGLADIGHELDAMVARIVASVRK
jgi:uncharacterized protein (DUF302 family)